MADPFFSLWRMSCGRGAGDIVMRVAFLDR